MCISVLSTQNNTIGLDGYLSSNLTCAGI